MRVLAGGRNAFRQDQSGSVAVWFTLAMLPALAAVGAAVDYSRAAEYRSKLQQATDGATLAVGGSAGERSDDQIVAAANQHFQAMMRGVPGDPKIDRVEISPGRTEVKVFSSMAYNPVFIKQAGVGPLTLTARASTIKSNMKYEIALVLDNSGSMGSSAGGVSKMQAAKDAAKKLVDTMYASPTSAQRTKISLVPFTLSVKIGNTYANASWMDRTGQSSIHWENINRGGSSWQPGSRFDLFEELGVPWAGCVEMRPGVHATSDAPPNAAVPDSMFVPQFAPDEPGQRGETSYYLNTGLRTGSGTRYTYANSYLNDDAGACSSLPDPTDVNARQDRVCKYRINRSSSQLNLSSSRGPNWMCDARPLHRLTSSPSVIKTQIDQMTAAGNTNLTEGFMWGWRTLSPNAPFSDGVPYSETETRKIMIFMTDGMNVWNSASNHNRSIFSPFGYYKNGRFGTSVTNTSQARAAMDQRTLTACANAKSAGVIVYTVGFSTPGDPIDTAGLNLMRQCATSTSMAYVASNASDINNVFEEIARNIGTLRISQ